MICVGEPELSIDTAALVGRVIDVCRDVAVSQEGYLCDLDRAIGDGDHGTNMRRGLEALAAERQRLSAIPLSDAMIAAGTILVMNIGGAAGPLYGTLLLETGKGLSAGRLAFPQAFVQAVTAVARRGRASPGDKTLLDVLVPLGDALVKHTDIRRLAEEIQGFADMTIDMKAVRGRASFLGERSIGHMDPGAASCALLAATVCREWVEAGRA